MKSELDSSKDNYILFAEFFRRNLVVITGSILLCVAFATVIYALIKPNWKAVAVLRVGMLPSDGKVETLGEIAERVKLDEFIAKVFSQIEMPDDEYSEKARKLYGDSLRVLSVKNTDYVQISVVAITSDQAVKQTNATVKELIVAHNAIKDPIVKNLQAQLLDTENRMMVLRGEIFDLEKKLINKKSVNADSLAFFLLGFLNDKESELSRLAIRQADLRVLLSPRRNYPTSVLEPTKIKEIRSPIVWFLFMGLLVGGVLGILVARYREKKRTTC